MLKILVFGSCNIDSVYSVDHIVRPGETLSATECETYPGGKGFNQAMAIAQAGTPVYFAGCIGKDGVGLKSMLAEAGVNLTYLKTSEHKTGQAIIQVDRNGENSIFIFHGANDCIDSAYIDEVLQDFSDGDFILLQNEISNLDYLIEHASQKGMKIILNPSPFTKQFVKLNLNDLFCIVLNETEAAQWADTNCPFDFITMVKQQKAQTRVVLTLGEKGCLYWCDEKIYRYQAYKTLVRDTTAAGDTFTGYFVSGLFHQFTNDNIFKTASAAAAIAISRQGAASSIPAIAEVHNRMPEMHSNLCNEIAEQKQLIDTYLENNMQSACMEEMAILLGYSKEYTSKWIKAKFNLTFSELLHQKRCCCAADYLKNTNIPVEEIIDRVGYHNGNYFRKVFLEQYGMLPMEYRKIQKKL